MPTDDGKSTVVERPGTGPREASKDEPRAVGSIAPGVEPPSGEPRRSRRSIPPETRYASGDEIGRGGMGRVVEATDTLLDRRVAVKEALTTDAELLRRFARETKITAKLEHPSIVPVYDAGESHGSPYYVMRRVTGRPLSELIRNAPTLSERLALVPHVLAAAQAIAHAHQRGIIHRDIKPSNILVGELGETVVIDWGLAKVVGEADDASTAIVASPGSAGARSNANALRSEIDDAGSSLRTRIGAVFGTPGFMAPEQLSGEDVRLQGDVYALGASLYNLLAGEPPHYTEDSTQMMKLAGQGPPAAIADLVPGVPAELSTIVDTALDYDTARRYRDAAAFAEELKQFLAGQLVASHRYSAIERLVRFVRQHRAAVAIGGAATVLLLVVGGFAVSQIVEERDRADEQARLATQGKREADAARAMADERADQLLLSRARTLLETNPTAAVASLKLLSAKSPRLGEAHAIANAARQRGVAWAIQGPPAILSYGTLDPAGVRLALVTVEGEVSVWDLDARKQLYTYATDRGVTVRWLRDGSVLFVGGRGTSRLFDPATGVEQPSNLPDLLNISCDEAGNILVGSDPQGRMLRIDLRTNTTTVLPISGVTDTVVSPRGTWVGVAGAREATVFDAEGRPRIRYPNAGTVLRVAVSETKAAVIDNIVVAQAVLGDATPRFQVLQAAAKPGHRPLNLDFLKERLYVIWTDTRVLAEVEGTELRDIGRIDVTGSSMDRFANDYMLMGTDGRKVHFTDGARLQSFFLPIALRFTRLVARAGRPRVVAAGDGAITVTELGVLPTAVELSTELSSVFVGEDTLFVSNSMAFRYSWYNIPTRTMTPFSVDGIGSLVSVDRQEARIVLVHFSAGKHASTFRANQDRADDVVGGEVEHVQLIRGGGFAYSIGNVVYGGMKSPYRELFRTDGNIQMLVRMGPHRFAAIAERELVRYGLETSTIERIPIEALPKVTYAAPLHGDVVFARANKLFHWGKTLEVFAEFDVPIEQVFGISLGLVVILSDGATMFVTASDKRIHRVASPRGTVLASETRLIVPGQFFYDVVELPSLARWSLPIMRTRDNSAINLDISPSGNTIAEKRFDGNIWLWQMPPNTTELSTVLDATNLTEDANGLLLWPWQKSN